MMHHPSLQYYRNSIPTAAGDEADASVARQGTQLLSPCARCGGRDDELHAICSASSCKQSVHKTKTNQPGVDKLLEYLQGNACETPGFLGETGERSSRQNTCMRMS
jgi:hypothetical protein